VLIIEIINITSLTLVRELGGIGNHVTVSVVPSVIVVSVNFLLSLNLMHEDFVLSSTLFEFRQPFDKFRFVVKASGYDESLVGILSTVRELDLVLFW
jgi:hypothetical protein